MYGHQPRYTSDNDAAETDMCTVRMSTVSHTSCGLRLTLNIRSENISSLLTMITGLDRVGQ